MRMRAMGAILAMGMAAAGCGLSEDVEGVKKLNDALEQQLGGEPSVNYSRGSDGKVIVVKFYAEPKNPETAGETTRSLVKTHVQKVDKIEVWQCTKSPGGIETCSGL